jgi:hypothetical protein
MMCLCSNSWLAARCATPRARARPGRRVNFDRLTLVTFVIAVAGFAGTAIAGGAPFA